MNLVSIKRRYIWGGFAFSLLLLSLQALLYPSLVLSLCALLPILGLYFFTEKAPDANHYASESALELHQFAEKISDNTSKNAISAARVSFSSSRLKKSIDNILHASQRIESNAEQMIVTEQQTAHLSERGLESSSHVRTLSAQSQESLHQSIEYMHKLEAQSRHNNALVETLNARSHDIQAITLTIQEIAGQTNLLALNAAIEAARAGEHGRGFAVVADEVRNLASRTSSATQEVDKMVNDIQQQTQQVAAQLKQLIDDVTDSIQLVTTAGGQLDNIAQLADSLEAQMQEIAQGTQNNHQQLDELFHDIRSMHTNLEESDQETVQLTDDALRLEEQVETLNEQLSEIALSPFHQRMYDLAQQGAAQALEFITKDIEQGNISAKDLFDRHYQVIDQNSSITTYRSRFDAYTDQRFPSVQEHILKQHPHLLYSVFTTNDGYIPTHNQHVSLPLTGNYEYDLAHHRSKRVYTDPVSTRCGTHTQSMLLQTYVRDTGELMHDLSVPLYIAGKHWGCFRLGYRPQ